MENEYIIINKKTVKLRLKLSEGIRDENIRVNIQDELNFLLSQSIPLTPEIGKAFDAGNEHGMDFDFKTWNKRTYIENLKLKI